MKQPWHIVLEVLVVLGLDAVVMGEYCLYIDEDYGRLMSTHCPDGCCREHGDEDEICCFTWSIGVIIGVIISAITIIAGVATIIICCYMAKRKRRLGSVMVTPQPQNSTAVIYTGGPDMHQYAYQHPPSGYYPRQAVPTVPPTAIYGEGGVAYPAQAQLPPPSYSQATRPSNSNNAGLFQVGENAAQNGGTSQNKYGGYGT